MSSANTFKEISWSEPAILNGCHRWPLHRGRLVKRVILWEVVPVRKATAAKNVSLEKEHGVPTIRASFSPRKQIFDGGMANDTKAAWVPIESMDQESFTNPKSAAISKM